MTTTLLLTVQDDAEARSIADTLSALEGVTVMIGQLAPANAAGKATVAQTRLIAMLCTENGIGRDERHAHISQLIGRQIKSTKQMTLSEASRVIEVLKGEQKP